MNILQLSTYPIINPSHGGQIRTKSIKEDLIDKGHNVTHIAIYDAPSGVEASPTDIPFGYNSNYYDLSNAKFLDFLTGLYATNSEIIYNQLIRTIKNDKIEVIMLEQPWLYLVAKKLAQSFKLKIVYSSQNIEYRLKESMFSDKEVSDKVIRQFISAVEELEKDVILNSDLIFACTESDAQDFSTLLKFHNKKAPVIIAGNGVEPFTVDKNVLSNWQKIFSLPYPVFVGSAHEPNSNGFWKMLAPGLTFLKPQEEIAILGGVSEILLNDKKFKTFESLNRSHLHLLGKRPVDDLRAIILNSHLVILPICEGEGSNLKTAEALESGRPIVATSKAFRGYEQAMNLPHVYIEDTSQGFRNKIREILDSPRYELGTPKNIKLQYHWKNQLKAISSAINTLST